MGVMTEIYHEKVFCCCKSFIFDDTTLKEVFVKSIRLQLPMLLTINVYFAHNEYNRRKIQAYKLFLELSKYFFLSIIPLHSKKLIIGKTYSKFE